MPTRAPTHTQLLRRLRPDQPSMARPDGRPSRSRRGYDTQWLATSKLYRALHTCCAECERKGRVTAAQCVDHIVPFNGLADPLRLDWANLQSLCKPCHSRKTSREDGGFGRQKKGH
jgi:5-methylcytosine-specific restriction enzyme A